MRSKSKAGSREPIEFKGTSFSVLAALLSTLDVGQLAACLDKRLGRTPDFFSGDPTLIDLSQCELLPETADWPALIELLRQYKLTPVAARVSGTLADGARLAGLAVVDEGDMPRTTPPAEACEAVSPVPEPTVNASAPVAPAPLATVAPAPNTLIVDRPLRSGQRVYAKGGDVVVLAMVSAGAEVIADGSIHVYAPLRGRALAGALGNAEARIFTTSFEAELVSVAGVYRNFIEGIPQRLAHQPVQVRLAAKQAEADKDTLSIEPLQIN